MEKTVIGGKRYELKRVKYHCWSPMSGYYRAAVKFKGRWWNCNDVVIKNMEERKVVPETTYILFYSKCEDTWKLQCQIELLVGRCILAKCSWPAWLPWGIRCRKVWLEQPPEDVNQDQITLWKEIAATEHKCSQKFPRKQVKATDNKKSKKKR